MDTVSWMLAHMWSIIILSTLALGGLKLLIDRL